MDVLNNLYELSLEFRIKKAIRKSWGIYIKIGEPYEMVKIDIKEYGFESLISIPMGLSLIDFRQQLPQISTYFNSDVIAEYDENREFIKMKCHFLYSKIDSLNNVFFKWYKTFSSKNCRNEYGETYKLELLENIYSTIDENRILGYKFEIIMPEGLSYSLLEDKLSDLNKTIGFCSLKFEKDDRKIYLENLETCLNDDEHFEIIPVKPYEMYVGMTHAYKPIILNYKNDPNAIWGGKTNTGKTLSMVMGLTNLLSQYKSDVLELFIIMLSDKQDLRVFKNLEQCKFYANNVTLALSCLNYLSKECARRNALFEKADKYGGIVNIYDYNKQTESKLPLIYLAIDEIASFSVDGNDGLTEKEKSLLLKCNTIMWKLTREGRSVGVYVNMATQRGDTKNLDANIKGNLSNQLCFYFPNMPSALTILGDEYLATSCMKLRTQREFVCIADKVYEGKTIYLTLKMVIALLKPFYEDDKKHLNLLIDGAIAELDIKNNVVPLIAKNDVEDEVASTLKETNKKKTNRFSNWKKGVNRN